MNWELNAHASGLRSLLLVFSVGEIVYFSLSDCLVCKLNEGRKFVKSLKKIHVSGKHFMMRERQ